jgi:hypothetical protein
VTGEWRRLRDDELHNLYSSPNVIRMIKSRRMGWSEQVEELEEEWNAYRLLVGNPVLYIYCPLMIIIRRVNPM